MHSRDESGNIESDRTGPPKFISLLREAYDKNETLCNIIKEIRTEDIIDNAMALFVHMFKEHLSEKLIKSIESALALC